jgi:glutamine amidotransferase
MIAIIDYGMGNLRSVQKAFEKNGAAARIVPFPRDLANARGIVLPGVGAFGQAMNNLRAIGWDAALREAVQRGVPFIGICLGMQLLFESSDEMGQHEGLGILHGEVKRFTGDLKIPQMGWNQIHVRAIHPGTDRQGRCESPLLRDVPNDSYAFFVHSYYCAPRDAEIALATTDYGIEFASVVGDKNVFGAQFHPEKSQSVGLKMLENFAAMTK